MKNSNIISIIILTVGIIAASYLLADGFKNRNATTHKIEVKGMAERNFTSDLIVWSGSFYQEDYSIKDAFKKLKSDIKAVKQYLAENGVSDDEVIFDPVDISERYRNYYDENNNYMSSFVGYRLNQRIRIKSEGIERIENVSRNVSKLIDQGITFSSERPDYYYTKLSSLKQELVEEATKDGRERAEKISSNANSRIGKLLYANLGVFQITGQYSNEDYSWGGSFNTVSKDKTASITVRLIFETK